MGKLLDSRVGALLWAAASGILMSAAWQTPGTGLCALYGWGATLALVKASHHPHASYRTLYLTGLIQNLISFYWISGTAQEFGGFSALLSLVVLALFALTGSVQNLLYFFLFTRLPSFLDRVGVRCAFAWVTTECVFPRIFPWHLGHTQLGFGWLAQTADLAGAMLISFVMLWLSEALCIATKCASGRYPRADAGAVVSRLRMAQAAVPALLIFCALLTYGKWRFGAVDPLSGTALNVTLVQANISTERKGDIQFFTDNREQYLALTNALPPRPELVVWPETVIQDFIFEKVGTVDHDARLPHFPGKHLLSGALTFRSKSELFNSALSVFSDGAVPLPYHKQILMPFGEYMPLASVFPWIQDLNPIAGGLTAGTSTLLTEFPALPPVTPRSFKVGTLICYEDIVPSLSREAVTNGATLLVNLTNDAWFGDTIAPLQHHLIASFRAIETRRYLVRATNSGFTAIVDPRGTTTASIPIFSEGTASTEVHLRDDMSAYVRQVGDIPWWVFSGLTVLSVLLPRRK